MNTEVDASGDTDPSWGNKFTLCATKEKLEDARLILEVYHEEVIVGSASLPLLDVVDTGGYDSAQDYTVKLKWPSGRPHGKLELAICLRERRGVYGAPPPGASPYGQNADPGYNLLSPILPLWWPTPIWGSPSALWIICPCSTLWILCLPSTLWSQSQPPAYQETPPAQQEGSKFGGIGTGLAIGAVAGAIGGLALGEYIDHKEDEAAEEQAEEYAERYAEAREDGYGGGDADY
ncbi:hypothetical protein GOP47_0016000 [Adiantum capillus-veneris]|uniref:C2 domain-containing protein n=1 Tax=Adiantum capillus-veneris TaxID=13818 RepID=A0A9D4ZC48_ADICA|nr:hypothetical protein GOP47_0016000 [Adiantum capillus-veneris]